MEIVSIAVAVECSVFDIVLPDRLKEFAALEWFGVSVPDIEVARQRTDAFPREFLEDCVVWEMSFFHPATVAVFRLQSRRVNAWRGLEENRSEEVARYLELGQELIGAERGAVMHGIEIGEIPDPREHMVDLFPKTPRGRFDAMTIAERLARDTEWQIRVQERWLEIDPEWEGSDDVG